MHKPLRSLGVTALLGGALVLFAGLALGAPTEEPIQLKPGDSHSLRIGLPQLLFDEAYPSFQIEVPSNALGVRVWTTGATGDVTLSGTLETDFSADYDNEGEFGYVEGSNVWLDEDMLITVADASPLLPGTWTFTLGTTLVPDEVQKFKPISCVVHYEIVEPAQLTIRRGQTIEIDLQRKQGMRAILSLPKDFQADRNSRWRVEAYSADHDIDLVIGASNPITALEYPYSTSIREIGFERAEFKGRQLKNLSIQVYAIPQLEVLDTVPVIIRLLDITNLSNESGALSSILPKVAIPSPAGPEANPIERASRSSVAVYSPFGSGSGTLISKQGYVLTNAHVVSGSHIKKTAAPTLAKGGKEWSQEHEGRNAWLPSIHGGFNLDPRRPAAPSVGMEIIAYRQDLDLALLRIVSTLDGLPLPDDLDLGAIAIPMGSSLDLSLGSRLTAIGYPMTGGSSALVSVTATQGICAGFTMELEGPAIKTDAGTHSGLSGGTLIDAAGLMVGIPSASITDANYAGGIGFAIPVESIPAEWLQLAGVQLPGPAAKQVSAPSPVGPVGSTEHAAACGCALAEVGRCGNFVEIDGTYLELANSNELGLGAMEWCKRSGVTVLTKGDVRDGRFHALTLREQKQPQ
jgi:hypothetical protein